jgi:ABC-2 type transport system permease protein
MIAMSREGAAAKALAVRDLRRYFGSPTGYVFITLFILLSAAAAFWRPRFFLNSLANLDQLNEVFPYVLVFFVPAVTMNLWADERKQGTDELLLTLPATEATVVCGKYLAALGIYLVSVGVSLSHALVLRWLGHPDWGLLAANYVGFALVGAALLPAAMLASLVTSNATIAFIGGALLVALPVGLGDAARTFSDAAVRRVAGFTVWPYFTDFTRGIVSLNGVVYFVAVAALFLYVDVAILQRRRWRIERPVPKSAHVGLRTVALGVICACVVVLAGRTRARLDLTAERLYSLSAETRALLSTLPGGQQVSIQAFISPDVPEPLVQTRENLLGVLREIEARAGGRVVLTVNDTEPYSEQARIARERFDMAPRRVPDPLTGAAADDVYMGVAVTSGAEEDVVPFFERGLAPEYELARAIRVVTRTARKRVGILDADVRVLGGVDEQNEPHAPWAVVQELKKQYDVVEVTPASASDAAVDVLIAVEPSRMTQTDLNAAMPAIERGTPTLMLLDPLPMIDLRLAPASEVATQIDPYRPDPAARLVSGNIRGALDRLGINWVPARIVWDGFNPHPDMAGLPQETVFVSPGNGNANAFNRSNLVTAHLQELMFLYPGYMLPAKDKKVSFEPLVQTGSVSGASSFFDLVVPTRQGIMLNGNVTRESDHRQYTIAARVRSTAPLSTASGSRPIDVIAIADLDMISDYFFNVRATAPPTANFDNITFFLNAIDLLAKDEGFIALRSRQGRHRTLERLEAQTRTFVERRTKEEQQAETDARTALDDARRRLQKRVDEVNARTDLDVQAKQILVRNVQETENRSLRVLEGNISQARDAKIRASREAMDSQIRSIRARIRTLAVLLPPAPVLIVGLVIFLRRARRERESARAMHRLVEVA